LPILKASNAREAVFLAVLGVLIFLDDGYELSLLRRYRIACGSFKAARSPPAGDRNQYLRKHRH
jgi:hypothetical protein